MGKFSNLANWCLDARFGIDREEAFRSFIDNQLMDMVIRLAAQRALA